MSTAIGADVVRDFLRNDVQAGLCADPNALGVLPQQLAAEKREIEAR
nr:MULTISPECIES: hypothetical protein [unclassified Rhodococcus (in: high G+C Gram-positive bacteria)]